MSIFSLIFLSCSLSCCLEVSQYLPILKIVDLTALLPFIPKFFCFWFFKCLGCWFYIPLVLKENLDGSFGYFFHFICPIACFVVPDDFNFYQFCKMVIWEALLPIIPIFLCHRTNCFQWFLFYKLMVLTEVLVSTCACILDDVPSL